MSHHHLSLRARRIVAAATCTVLATMGLTVATGTAAGAQFAGADSHLRATWEPVTLTWDGNRNGKADVGDTITVGLTVTALDTEVFVLWADTATVLWDIVTSLPQGATATFTNSYVVTPEYLSGPGGSDVNLGDFWIAYDVPTGEPGLLIPGPDNYFATPGDLTVATTLDVVENSVPDDHVLREGDTVSYTTTLTNTTTRTMTLLALPGYSDFSAPVDLAPGASATFHVPPVTVTYDHVAAGGPPVPDTEVSWSINYGHNGASTYSGTTAVPHTGVTLEELNTTVDASLTFIPRNADGTPMRLGDADAGDVIDVRFGATNNGNVTMQYIAAALGSWASGLPPRVVPDSALAPSTSLPNNAWRAKDLRSANGGYFRPYVLTSDDVTKGYVDLDGALTVAPSLAVFEDSPSTYTHPFSKRVFLKNFTMSSGLFAVATLNDTNGDGIGQAGETVDYRLRFRNNSNQILAITDVYDLRGSDIAGQAASKFVGKQIPIDDVIVKNWPHTITADDEARGSIQYGASVEYSGVVDGDTASRTAWAPAIPTGAYVAPATTVDATSSFVDVNGDGKLSSGEDVTIEVRVENTGAYPLTGVVVTDALGSDMAGLLGTFPTTFLPGDSLMLDFVYKVTKADEARGVLIYAAQMTADGMARAQMSPLVSLPVVAVPAPPTTLTAAGSYVDANGDGKANAGETVTVTVTATNVGTYSVTGLAVTDGASADATGLLPAFPPLISAGASVARSFTHVLTAADQARGTFRYTASMTADGMTATPSATSVALAVSPYAAPSSTLTAAGTYVDANSDGKPSIGETVTVTVTAANTGTYPLTGLVVTDAPGADVTGLLPAFSPSLAAGASAEQSFTYVLKAADFARGSFGYAAKMTADGLPATVSSASVNLTDISFQAYATDLDGVAAGGIEVCGADGKPTDTVVILDTIGVKPVGCDYANPAAGYRVVGFSTPVLLGTDTFSVKVPVAIKVGAHRIALYAPDGSLVGWKSVTAKDPIAFSGPGVETAPATGLKAAVGGLASTGTDAGMLRGTLTTAALLMALGAAGVAAAARRRKAAGE